MQLNDHVGSELRGIDTVEAGDRLVLPFLCEALSASQVEEGQERLDVGHVSKHKGHLQLGDILDDVIHP